jgi:hypothetical protein
VPLLPVYPAAWTIEAPGVVDADVNALPLLAVGLLTLLHAVPFQFRVSVCAEDEPDGR